MVQVPSPEQQAQFFIKLQRLLAEGEFVSTYKFALLICLVRWAVENPDFDESTALDVGEFAPHFVALYWPQAHPFGSERMLRVAEPTPPLAGFERLPGVLIQDRGRQIPAVLRLICEEHSAGVGRFTDLPLPRRKRLLGKVRTTIKAMPLRKLHQLRGTGEFRFLYQVLEDGGRIRFEPGILSCLRGFSQLTEDIVRASWLRFVLRCNPKILGRAHQVEGFLWPESRAALAVWRPVLEAVQGDACFYCGASMRGDVVIDHFLPWARYPRDLGDNFVLAHSDCNGRKSDHLASCEHLERWCQRQEEHRELLPQLFDARRLPHDWPTLRRVAASLYQIAESAGSNVWLAKRTFVPLDSAWRTILGVA